MERQVPVYSAGRKNPLAVRLADVPSLFSEGSDREQPARPEPFWRLSAETLLRRLSQIKRGAARQ
jgi:hypothetical protein